MAKILKDTELAEIVSNAVSNPEILDDSDQYHHFLQDLVQLICDHFGGDPGEVWPDTGDGLGWTVGIEPNDSLPTDGGVFKHYDRDVQWVDGKEV